MSLSVLKTHVSLADGDIIHFISESLFFSLAVKSLLLVLPLIITVDFTVVTFQLFTVGLHGAHILHSMRVNGDNVSWFSVLLTQHLEFLVFLDILYLVYVHLSLF